MSISRRRPSALAALAALAVTGCPVPYPVVISGGPFEVPPGPSREPLDARGARVQVVAAAPPRCRFLGLATGVGGVEDSNDPGSDARYGELQARAVVALRNAVGAAGGTHTVVDAEETFFKRELQAVLVRGPALACGP